MGPQELACLENRKEKKEVVKCQAIGWIFQNHARNQPDIIAEAKENLRLTNKAKSKFPCTEIILYYSWEKQAHCFTQCYTVRAPQKNGMDFQRTTTCSSSLSLRAYPQLPTLARKPSIHSPRPPLFHSVRAFFSVSALGSCVWLQGCFLLAYGRMAEL